MREIVLDPSSGEPPVPVYDPSGPYTDDNVTIDVEKGLQAHPRRMGARARWRRGVRRPPIKPVDNGNVTGKHLARNFPEHAAADARRRRRAGHPARMGARGHHHQGDDLRRRAREPRPQDRCSSAPRRRSPTARASAPRVPAFVTPEFVRDEIARGRAIIPSQHQPRRARADDHRPQLPREDQRQYRQLGGHRPRSRRRSRRWCGRSAGAPTP